MVCYSFTAQDFHPLTPCQSSRRTNVLKCSFLKGLLLCHPASLPVLINGVAGGHGSSLPLDYKRPALGGPQVGGRGQAEQHDRIGGGGQSDRHPQHQSEGHPAGELADPEQAKELLAVPDRSTRKGKRDYVILALLVGCALRRNELAELDVSTIQQREGRWVLADLEGKGRRIRTVAIPIWVKQKINAWMTAAAIEEGRLLRSISKSGKIHRDLGDPVPEGGPVDIILYLAISENAFQSDELPFLESLGELREIPPGIDAMPFGAAFVVTFVALPAFLSCDVEDDVLFVVLSGFGFCGLPEAADEDNFVEHGVWLRFFWFVRCLRYMLAQRVCRRDPLPRRLDRICGRGPELALGQESPPCRGAQRILGRRACVRRAAVF